MRRRVWFAAAAAAILAAAGAVVLVVLVAGDDVDERASGETPPAVAAEERCAPSGDRLEVAIQDNATLLHRHYGDRDTALRLIGELGVTWVRASLLWHRVVPRPERRMPPEQIDYDFSEYDSFVDAVAERGLCVELTIVGPAPAWASGEGRVGVHEPDAELFADFARAAAEHFRGRVTRYSIWNEPNFVAWLTPQADAPEIYRALYEAGHAAIEEVDPGAEVLIGETAAIEEPGRVTAPLAFLRELTCRDRDYQPERECEPLEADGYAHHPYEFDHPPEYRYPGRDNAPIGALDNLTEALDRLAAEGALLTPEGQPLPLYLTEFGYFASGRRRTPDRIRAEWLPRAFEVARRNPRVRQMLQYLLLEPPPDYPGGSFNTGIVSRDGDPGPAYRALAEWAGRAREEGLIAVPRQP